MADYSAQDFKPTVKANKDQEMAVRRAYELNAALMDGLTESGTIQQLKDDWHWAIIRNSKLKDLFLFTPTWDHKDVWEWVVDHWYSGALRRSVVVTMQNMHSDNVKAIKGKINELYR